MLDQGQEQERASFSAGDGGDFLSVNLRRSDPCQPTHPGLPQFDLIAAVDHPVSDDATDRRQIDQTPMPPHDGAGHSFSKMEPIVNVPA